jgi:hypothetical protein
MLEEEDTDEDLGYQNTDDSDNECRNIQTKGKRASPRLAAAKASKVSFNEDTDDDEDNRPISTYKKTRLSFDATKNTEELCADEDSSDKESQDESSEDTESEADGPIETDSFKEMKESRKDKKNILMK